MKWEDLPLLRSPAEIAEQLRRSRRWHMAQAARANIAAARHDEEVRLIDAQLAGMGAAIWTEEPSA